MSNITCPNCGNVFELNEVLIEQVRAESDKAHKEEMRNLEKRIREEENEKSNSATEKAVNEALRDQMETIEALKIQLDAQNRSNEQLRADLKNYMDKFAKMQESKDNLEIEMKKKLDLEREDIRIKAQAAASLEKEQEILQLKKKLQDAEDSVNEAKKKMTQGSQQTQGEVLELELEDCLANNFRDDIVEEVKKGERGADVRQFVQNRGQNCGLILWETKNAKWSNQWIPKLKEDMLRDKATVGVIVSVNMPEDYGDFVEKDGVWIIRPMYAMQVASLLRKGLIGIHQANMMAESKDAKMEFAFRYITGPEFKNRVISIVDNYKALQEILEAEKRATNKRWAKQQKAIEMVIENTSGLYGDFQGILGPSLSDIKQLNEPDNDIEE